MLSLGVANSSDASEILCLSYILSDASFEEHILKDTPWRAGLLAGSVFLGMLLGGLFIGTLGDWVGRKPILMVGLLCNSLAGILSAFCANVIQLSLLRCVAGLGIGATVPPLFTLVTELAPPSRRGFFVSVAASFWMVGSIYVALSALVFLAGLGTSWRVFAVACALPSAVGAVLVVTFVPESPRFLALQGRSGEGLRVVNNLALQMEYSGPPLTLSEILLHYPGQSSGSQRVSPYASVFSIGWLSSAMHEAFLDFRQSTSKLYTPQLRSTTLPLQMVWFSLSFGSYGILMWINSLFVAVHLENVYFNSLLFAFSNLPGNVLSGVLMDRSGRSVMLIGSVLSAAMSLVSFAVFAGKAENSSISATGIVMSACCFQAFTIAAWNTIDCMTSELFPTTVRSTGMGVCAASGRIGAMIAQFVNGALVSHPVRLLLVASFSLVLGATTPCLLPGGDMAQQPLEDGLTKDKSNSDDDPLPFLPSGVSLGTPYACADNSEQSYSSVEDNDKGIVSLT
jgi:VNT family MFS transporter (synaptic vesicle glycoprotein 2)